MQQPLNKLTYLARSIAVVSLLLASLGCEFDTSGSGQAPGLGEGKPCIAVAIKYSPFEPGITIDPPLPVSSIQQQCVDRADTSDFSWQIEHRDMAGDIREVGVVTEINSVKSSTTPQLECIARAFVGSSIIFGVIDGQPDFFDPNFTFGSFRVTHSADGWSRTCPFVEVTTCPNPLSGDVTPIAASHATRDASGCEQGTANVPIGVGPVEDNVPFP